MWRQHRLIYLLTTLLMIDGESYNTLRHRTKSEDDIIQAGTIDELTKHGIKISNINDLLFGNRDPLEMLSTASTTTPTTTTSTSFSSSSSIPPSTSWLLDACNFVKQRAVVRLPSICHSRFSKNSNLPIVPVISAEQRKRCHKLEWHCVASALRNENVENVDREKKKCVEAGGKCMAQVFPDRE